MAGADHGCNRPLAFLGSWRARAVGSDRSPARKFKRGRNRFLFRKLARVGALFFIDASYHQRLADPPLAIAASGQRPGLGKRKGAVINVAQFHHPVGEFLNRRLAFVMPAAFAQFAMQIGKQLRPARGEPSDIVQRQFFQLFRR